MTRWIGILGAVLLAALPATASAQSGDIVGCWRDPGPDVTSTVCFEPDGVATFSLHWALDEGTGWTEGRCSGFGEVTTNIGLKVGWEVPWQADSCFQDGAWDRLARRTYDCTRSSRDLTCTVHVYLDDGTEWGDPAVGVIYEKQ